MLFLPGLMRTITALRHRSLASNFCWEETGSLTLSLPAARNRAKERGARPRPSRPKAARSATFRQVLRDEFPVHEVIEEGLDEVRPAVLVVEVVGMLPHIAGEERGVALSHRVDRVGRLHHLERAAIEHEPSPAAAELAGRRLLELLLELVEAAEGLLDRLEDLTGGLAAAARPQAIPEEGVVPALRRVVEDLRLGFILGGGADHVLERLAGEGCVLH